MEERRIGRKTVITRKLQKEKNNIKSEGKNKQRKKYSEIIWTKSYKEVKKDDEK